MSHQSVRLLLQDVAKSLADNIQFGYGRHTEFNIISNRTTFQPPYIWLLPLTAGGRFRNDTKTKRWNVAMLFMDHDRSDASHDESTVILDTQDTFVEKFMQALDDWSERSYDTLGPVTLENDSQNPFYKDNAGIHTGWRLDFQIIVSDDFTYCTPENVELYAGNI